MWRGVRWGPPERHLRVQLHHHNCLTTASHTPHHPHPPPPPTHHELQHYGTIPKNVVELSVENFKRELRALRRSVRYDELSQVGGQTGATWGPLLAVLAGIARVKERGGAPASRLHPMHTPSVCVCVCLFTSMQVAGEAAARGGEPSLLCRLGVAAGQGVRRCGAGGGLRAWMPLPLLPALWRHGHRGALASPCSTG